MMAPDNPISCIVYHTNVEGKPYYKLVNFGHEDDKNYWKHRTLNLKEEMENINQSHNSQAATWIDFLLEKWLRFVQEELIDEFGVSSVPLDIRNTVHSVQNYFELQLTEFGPDFGEIDRAGLNLPDPTGRTAPPNNSSSNSSDK